ncbi:hypothetical protein K1T71_014476 [Dendrolimus kikuchii]|uniref:Uncharacterized protein n=1 Tax=Dendrolimus kikuchii TaxID=765133 RepID=A0ACC1CEF5_9NEOP|nr:hypothetical protein K1T71_014476 [Dendrolimus kikuchii]
MFNKLYFLFLCIGTLITAAEDEEVSSPRPSKGYCITPHHRTLERLRIDGIPISPRSQAYYSFYIIVSCPEGFKLIGKKIGRCVEGEYVEPPGECTPDNENITAADDPGLSSSLCYLPDHPKHGSYESTGGSHPEIWHAYYNLRLMFKCNHGYELQGSDDVRCEEGKWLGGIPTCVSKYGYLADPLETGISRSLLYCKDPDTLKHGSFSIQGDVHPDIPDAYTKFYLENTCNKGYQLYGERSISCKGGKWSAEMPLCGLPCPLKKDSRVDYMCETKKRSKICNDYVRPGEIVSPKCKDNITRDDLTVMRCGENGYFDRVVTCAREDMAVECGLITVSDGLIIGGFEVERGEVPWHVGIYTKITKPYMQICGGTIVTSTSVISAAHCFWSDNTNTKPPSDYVVAAGKIYRPWNDVNDIYAQKTEVMDIKIPILYFGSSANYQNDLAVLKLVTAIAFNRFVRPICLDFNEETHWNQLDDASRKVAGWGLKTEEGEASLVLKAVFLPIGDLDKCVNESPVAFKPYITSDKICAGYTNGTAVCKGDSGGGLTFHRVENGVYKHYLQGVVSTAPNYGLQQCNAFTWATFTSIMQYKAFIYSNTK